MGWVFTPWFSISLLCGLGHSRNTKVPQEIKPTCPYPVKKYTFEFTCWILEFTWKFCHPSLRSDFLHRGSCWRLSLSDCPLLSSLWGAETYSPFRSVSVGLCNRRNRWHIFHVLSLFWPPPSSVTLFMESVRAYLWWADHRQGHDASGGRDRFKGTSFLAR